MFLYKWEDSCKFFYEKMLKTSWLKDKKGEAKRFVSFTKPSCDATKRRLWKKWTRMYKYWTFWTLSEKEGIRGHAACPPSYNFVCFINHLVLGDVFFTPWLSSCSPPCLWPAPPWTLGRCWPSSGAWRRSPRSPCPGRLCGACAACSLGMAP